MSLAVPSQAMSAPEPPEPSPGICSDSIEQTDPLPVRFGTVERGVITRLPHRRK